MAWFTPTIDFDAIDETSLSEDEVTAQAALRSLKVKGKYSFSSQAAHIWYYL